MVIKVNCFKHGFIYCSLGKHGFIYCSLGKHGFIYSHLGKHGFIYCSLSKFVNCCSSRAITVIPMLVTE